VQVDSRRPTPDPHPSPPNTAFPYCTIKRGMASAFDGCVGHARPWFQRKGGGGSWLPTTSSQSPCTLRALPPHQLLPASLTHSINSNSAAPRRWNPRGGCPLPPRAGTSPHRSPTTLPAEPPALRTGLHGSAALCCRAPHPTNIGQQWRLRRPQQQLGQLARVQPHLPRS
jgi:hypothetical protein